MKYQEYQSETQRTFTGAQREIKEVDIELLHCVMGICTESGELLDNLKKSFFYNKQIDIINFKEELGDIMWYISNACRLLNFDFEKDVLQKNIDKLYKRYPEKFDREKALKRDLTIEYKELSK